MKKLFVGLLAATLMAFGLVSISGGSAVACADNYTGCVGVTKPKIGNKVRKPGANVKVRANFRAKSGDADIYGAVTLTCRNGRAVKSKTKGYAGPTNIALPNFNKRGVWKCTLTFYGANAKNATERFKVRVRR